MSVVLEKSRSCWMEIEPRRHESLDRNISCDVAVIGSGIAGLSTAYELALQGKRVIVLDRGPIGRGMTARTSAHLTTALDDLYQEYIAIQGEEKARKHFKSQEASVARIDAILAEERIDCDFARLDALLFLAGKATEETLDKEVEALGKVGLANVRKSSDGNRRHRLSEGPCLIIPRQGRFHPLKYLDGLAEALKKRGVALFADSAVQSVDEKDGAVTVRTTGGTTISAAAAVVATNTPINDGLTITAKEAPYRTFVLAGEVKRGAIDDALYWDTEEPYHYVRLLAAGGTDLLLIGGEDYKSGLENDGALRFERLERWGRERFPELGPIRYRWSGQVMDTIDYAAFIGRYPGSENIYIATGDSGQGLTHGVVAGLVIAGLIESGEHEWADIYDPSRKPARAAKQFLSESADVAKNFAEYVSPGELVSEEQLSPGSGGILRVGLHKVAVCRDEDGALHRLSASCTHSGCIVHWNMFEQCWDCPCHGSQFAADGSVLNGPATSALKPA
jgi:glycine/D-amino acid oxidase-like deaminating enzyme/nitrite reductase/ring-hydroxylating ferredoxin subunit